MAMPGETLTGGGLNPCPDCGCWWESERIGVKPTRNPNRADQGTPERKHRQFMALSTPAGHFAGTVCECLNSPIYTRETGYMPTSSMAVTWCEWANGWLKDEELPPGVADAMKAVLR